MPTLAEKLTDSDETRLKVVKACVALIDAEVAAKRGLSGMAIKTGYKVINAIKPNMVGKAVNSLLPEFAEALQPIYEKSTQGADDPGDAFAKYLTAHQDEAADALLAVTDAKAKGANNATIKATYDRLRGTAKANVVSAVPGLATALKPFA